MYVSVSSVRNIYRADVSTYDIQDCASDYNNPPITAEHQVCALGEHDADACKVRYTIEFVNKNFHYQKLKLG
jgi:hypothetical protein